MTVTVAVTVPDICHILIFSFTGEYQPSSFVAALDGFGAMLDCISKA